MRVNSHGKIDIAVPHQFLGDLRMHAARCQKRSKGVAQGVKVQFAVICLHEQEVALNPLAVFFRVVYRGLNPFFSCIFDIFMQEELVGVSTEAPQMVQLIEVYPNPASDQLHVVFDHAGEIKLSVIDITGRTVHSTRYTSGGFTNHLVNVSELNPGLFFLKLEAGSENQVVRFIKE